MSFEDLNDTTESHERRIVRCKAKGCNAKIFLETGSGKQMPCDADTVEPADQVFDSSKHTSHFSQCVAADKFRKPR